MKILMIIDRYIPIWGGAENQLKQLIPHLRHLDCDIKILTRRWHQDMKKLEIIDATPVYRLGIPGTNIFSTISYVLGLFIYSIRNRKGIDVIHSHGAAALGAVGTVIGSVIGKRNITKIASSTKIPKLQKSLFGKLVLSFFKKSSAIICMTDEILDELKAINVATAKIKRISNAVDVNRFKPGNQETRSTFRKERGWDEETPIILFSSRLIIGKGLDILVKAWPDVIKSFPDAKLIILGSGTNQIDSVEEEIKEQISSNNIENIHFEGDVTNPEVYLGISDIFVFPSRHEGISNALLEAMASGLCCIASAIGGNQTVMEDGKDGILFKMDNPESLSNAIIKQLHNPEERLRLGKNARNKVAGKYSFETISNNLLIYYKELIVN